jgi:catechol 2,3-dioxygenase-like lactoylglutathione lyase family enzyme
MTIALTKDSIDIGIVVKDADAALSFYRDTLGFEDTGSMPMPGGGGTMHRLLCGTTLVKLVAPAAELPAAAPPGGIQGAYGYRYWTISVSNLDEVTDRCATAGRTIVVKPREIRPGVRISIVEDPDGNWVEFLEVTPQG